MAYVNPCASYIESRTCNWTIFCGGCELSFQSVRAAELLVATGPTTASARILYVDETFFSTATPFPPTIAALLDKFVVYFLTYWSMHAFAERLKVSFGMYLHNVAYRFQQRNGT